MSGLLRADIGRAPPQVVRGRREAEAEWLRLGSRPPCLASSLDGGQHVLAGLVLRVQHGDLAGLEPAAGSSSEKNAWPADRQVGPIRKNQSRPASVRKVAGLSALTNGTSNRSDRWLAPR